VEDNGVDFALQALPEDYENLIVPLGIDAEEGTGVVFSANGRLTNECFGVAGRQINRQFYTPR
jgi:hypothetical protein